MTQTVRIGSKTFEIDPIGYEDYWQRVVAGSWEPETFAIFDTFVGSETLYLDIGAWIGSTVLFAAQAAAQAIAFEPDPVAFAALERNVALNATAPWADRLQIFNHAISRTGRSFDLGGRKGGGDSRSSALFPDRGDSWHVKAQRLGEVLNEARKPGQPVFMKIDIEGGEYDLLPGIGEILSDPGVTAYISFHPKMLRRSLRAESTDKDWKPDFVERHRRVVANLPFDRAISNHEGVRFQQEGLMRTVRRQGDFPEEILIFTEREVVK